MDRESIEQPHDKMFRELFSREDAAAGFLREVLPRAIAGVCDWDRLRLVEGSWIDGDMRNLESDRLYAVPVGGSEIRLYILFEHQSTPDKWMPLRLLVYTTRIWQEARKAAEADGGPARLPPIFPLVLYQGAAPWNVPKRLSGLVAVPTSLGDGIRAFMPDFEYPVFDLARTDPASIPGPQEVQTVLRIMRAAMLGSDAFLKALAGEAGNLDKLSLLERHELLLEVLLRYALVVNVDVDLAKVKSALTEARDPYIRRTVMSVAEKLIRQGREEGREEGIGFGRLQSSRNSLMRFLQVRFGADVATDLKPRIDAVEDPDLLEELLGEVYGAAGVEDVHRIMVQRGV